MNIENLKRKAAFILALYIPFSLAGCSNNKNNSNKSEDYSSSIIIEKIVNKIEEQDMTRFLEEMSSIIPIYNLEDIYFTEEEIEYFMKVADSNKECTNDNVVVDAKIISDRIISNSVNTNGTLKMNYDITIEEKEELDSLIKELLSKAIKNMVDRGVISKEDACTLESLKLEIGLTGKDSIIDYESSTNTLIMDYYGFTKWYEKMNPAVLRHNVVNEGFVRWLEYGLNCCRIKACDCRLEQGQLNDSISYTSNFGPLENIAIASGDNENLSEINKYLFDFDSEQAGYNVSPILLLAAFKDNRTIEDLNSLIFDCNLPGMFKYFGLETKEDVSEFYRIVNTVDVLTGGSDYENNYFAENRAVGIIEFRNHVGYAYKVSLFKNSIRDLMTHISTYKDLTKEEAMFLYRFVKNIAVNQTQTEIEGATYYYEPEFVNNIIGIENIYFEFLSKFYNIDIEEIDELYDKVYVFNELETSRNAFGIDCGKLTRTFPLLQYIQVNYRPIDTNIKPFDERGNRR